MTVTLLSEDQWSLLDVTIFLTFCFLRLNIGISVSPRTHQKDSRRIIRGLTLYCMQTFEIYPKDSNKPIRIAVFLREDTFIVWQILVWQPLMWPFQNHCGQPTLTRSSQPTLFVTISLEMSYYICAINKYLNVEKCMSLPKENTSLVY